MSEFSRYAGIDWGSESHQACVVDDAGEVLGERVFPHGGEGLGAMAEWILDVAGCGAEGIGAGIEVPHGPVVESLMDRGFAVHSVNPKQLDRFRDRLSPAGAKDDSRDAQVLADALRTDARYFRRLDPVDPTVVRLREWTRIAAELTAQRTALTNRARDQLWRYYPQFFSVEKDFAKAWAAELWKLAPTPAEARRIRESSVADLLRRHRVRRIDAPEVLRRLRERPIAVAPGTAEAAVDHLRIIAENLGMLRGQLKEAHRRMDELVAEIAAADDAPGMEGQRDVEILRSLPGVGRIVLATLLAEAPELLRRRDYNALRLLFGVAPVTRQSGKKRIVLRRLAAHKRLRNILYHWTRVSVQHDPVSHAKYRALRQRGHGHARALRSVGDRLLNVTCAMLRNQTTFTPLHQEIRHAA